MVSPREKHVFNKNFLDDINKKGTKLKTQMDPKKMPLKGRYDALLKIYTNKTTIK